MTELIKFNIIPEEDKEIAVSVKRSKRIIYQSVLITILILTVAIAGYILFESKEPGVMVETAPKILTPDDSTEAPVPDKKIPDQSIARITDSLLVDDNAVRIKILSTRENITKTLNKIIEINAPIRSINFSNCSEITVVGMIDNKNHIDSLFTNLKNSDIIKNYKPDTPKNTENNTNYTIKGILTQRDSIPDALKLQPVMPFNRGVLVNYFDSLITDNHHTLIDRKIIGNSIFIFGQRFDFELASKGDVENLMKFLNIITTTNDMAFIKKMHIDFDDTTAEIKANQANCRITISLYNPTKMKVAELNPEENKNEKDD